MEVSINIRINVGHSFAIWCSVVGTANFVFTLSICRCICLVKIDFHRSSPASIRISPNLFHRSVSLFAAVDAFSTFVPIAYCAVFSLSLSLSLFLLLFRLVFASHLWHLLIWHANGSIFLTSFVISLPFWWLLYTDRWQCLGSLSVSYVNAHKTQNMAAIRIKLWWS